MRKQNLEITNKIQAVNEHLRGLNLTPQQAEIKSEQDYILFYSNHLDTENKFAGVLQIPNQYHINLLNFLCDGEPKKIEFLSNFYKEDRNITLCIGDYRKHLIENRKLDINAELLQDLINSADWDNFWIAMQMLFMEKVDISRLKDFQKQIAEGLSAEDIIKCFNRGMRRMVSITSFPITYIKSF